MRQTILIVDDCLDIARIIARYLESAGYEAIVANSGVDARRFLEDDTPDAVILDLMMPGLTGAELLHDLRRKPATANIPVVLVSARVGYGGTHLTNENDADYCVGKPFTKLQIVHAVRTAIEKRATPAPPPSEMPLPRFVRPIPERLR